MDDSEPIDFQTGRARRLASAPDKPDVGQSASGAVVGGLSSGGVVGSGFVAGGRVQPVVSFDRHELREIFNLYGRMVAAGEWRDYAIDFTPQRAVFSIFRRTSETPLYRIEKYPKLARRQGAYCVIAATGLILKRGHELARVISVIDRKLKLV